MERTPAILLTDIERAIRPLIEADLGELDVVSDINAALELSGKAPKTWRCILNFNGYAPHSAAIEGMAYVRFVTIIQANIGLTATPQGRLYQTSVDGKVPFLTRVEQVSAWMRALKWPDGAQVDCRGLALDGSDWLEGGPAKTSSMALTWQLEMALPAFDENIIISLT